MVKHLRIHEVAEQLHVSSSSVRIYANKGLIDYDLTPNGQRVFTQEHVNGFMGTSVNTQQIMVFYTRSSNGNKELLNTQKTLLTKKYGEPHHIITDNESGLNENRKGLKTLMTQAKNGEITTICVTEKDRLTRFGYSYLEEYFTAYNVSIIVLDETTPKSLHDELLQDFMSLLANFSGKFYRLRGYEQKRALLDKVGSELDKTH